MMTLILVSKKEVYHRSGKTAATCLQESYLDQESHQEAEA